MKYKGHTGMCKHCGKVVSKKYKKHQPYPAMELAICSKCNSKVMLEATYE